MRISIHISARAADAAAGILLASLLAGCGGDGRGATAAPTAPAVTATVAKIEVSPASIFLRPGEVTQVSARVIDTAGNTLSGVALTWHAAGSAVTVTADGTVTAASAAGSTVIVASTGAVDSAPVTALVATLTAGTEIITDSQVLSGPVLIDTTQEPAVGAQLRMTLSGTGVPAVGSLVVGTGAKAIAGKVVSTAANGANTDVVFEVVPLTALFTQLKFSQVYAPRELTEKFDVQPASIVQRLDGAREYEWNLVTPDTPAPASYPGRAQASAAGNGTASSRRAMSSEVKPLADPTQWNVGPFKCTAKTDASPSIGFRKMVPHLINNMGPVTATINVDAGTFLAEVKTQGSMKLTVDGEVHVGGNLKGSIACDARLFKVNIPVPPILTLVFMPTVPVVGVRANVSGTLQQGGLVVGIKSEIEQPMRIGLRIDPDGTFTNLSSIDTANTTTHFEWTLNQADAADAVAFVGDAKAGLYAQASFTNLPLLAYGEFNTAFDPYKSLIDTFAGFHSALTLATVNAQIQDSTLAAGYNVTALIQAQVGDDLSSAFGWLSKLVKLGTLVLPTVKYEPVLFSQPVGTARATLRRFAAGDAVLFRVTLDPATVEPTFLGEPTVGYNVKQVEIWRKTPGAASERIGTAAGAPGQSNFSVSWTADSAGSTTDSRASADPANFYAVVVPNFGESFGFRVAPALGWLGVLQVGASNDQVGNRVAVDADGNVIIASYSQTPLAQENRPAVGGFDEVQILKLDPLGQLLWARSIDGPGDENVRGLVIDQRGAIYVSGIALNSPLTDAGTGAVGFSTWVARFDPNGDQRWLRQWQESTSFTTADFLALGPNRELYAFGVNATADPGYVGGSFLSFDCSKPNSSRIEPQYDCGDIALRRLDADSGALIWSKVDVRAGWQIARGLAVDPAGNIYTAAETPVDTQTQNAGESGDPGYDAYRSSYLETVPNSNDTIPHSGAAFTLWNPDGSVAWRSNVKNERQSTPAGDVYSDEVPHGIVAAGGSVWTVIRTTGSFPGTPGAGGRDSALFQLNTATGLPSFVALYGSAGDDLLALSGPTPGGDMLLFGSTTGSLFGPNAGGNDVVAVRLGPDGSQRWAQQFGGPGNDAGNGAGAANDGSVFVTGSTDGLMPATLSGLPANTVLNTPAGGLDMFVAKLGATSGTIQSAPPGAQIQALAGGEAQR